MGWGREVRRVLDPDLPIERRYRGLQCLVSEHHSPFGYQGTLEHLAHVTAVRRTFFGGRPRWTQEALLAALDELTRSRDSYLAYREAFAQRRRVEKAGGQRVPTAGDMAPPHTPEWIKDPAQAAVRHPSNRERRAAARLRP